MPLSFSSLVRNISIIKPALSKGGFENHSQQFHYPALQVFTKWVIELRQRFTPLPPGTTAICFRMLFPEEDVHRKYDIQEIKMAQVLAQCFGMEEKAFENWSLEETSGCLGQELKVVLERVCPHQDGFTSSLSLAEIDRLLNELASKSGFSHHSIRAKFPKSRSRSRFAIICSLFRHLSPEDASILTQIILKDLRPLMYPLTEFHYTTALTKFNTASVRMLTIEHAMNAWDPSRRMLNYYRLRASLSEAAAFAEQSPDMWCNINPVIHVPVAIPKSEKGLNCSHALSYLEGSAKVWAETKYDGERAQIHVEVKGDKSSRVTIFSKSKRDSTQDRWAVHDIIRRALRLNSSTRMGESNKITVRKNVILDAELVAFRGESIDEFWRIRELIQNTAHGIRRVKKHSNVKVPSDQASPECGLGLVFFDVISMDSVPLYSQSYAYRRKILEDIIDPEPGKSMIAVRYLIDMSTDNPDAKLQQIFAEHIASHQEGLVLKAELSLYNDYRLPWVKLKKDYIPGYGDTLDLVILGASWEKIRGRSLRVPPGTFTTFHVGALENKSYTAAGMRPKFHMYFTVSYGLNREELEQVNFLVKTSDPIPYAAESNRGVPYDLSILSSLRPSPAILLRVPLVVSLFGAGFTKAADSQHYELRFPRIEKVYRPNERIWKDAVDLETLHEVACSSVGRDKSDKDIKDWANKLWGRQPSPNVHSTLHCKARAELWNAKLGAVAKRVCGHSKSTIVTRHDLSEKREFAAWVNAKPLTLSPVTRCSNVLICGDSPQYARPALSPPSQRKTSVLMNTDKPPGHQQSSEALALGPAATFVSYSQIGALAWFSSPHSKCSSCRLWKKKIPHEARLHSLQSLLAGCVGTSESAVRKQGIIIIDESDENAGKWKNKVAELLRLHGNHVSITVLGCKSTP